MPASTRDEPEVGEALDQWSRVVRSLARQRDTDAARRWVRARAIDVAIHSIDGEMAREHEEPLRALTQAVHDLLDDLEPGIPAAQRAELERFLELRWERDRLQHKLVDAAAAVRAAFEERSQRRVREWFAEELAVSVLEAEPVPTVQSLDDANAALATAEAGLRAAEAACPPRPDKNVLEALADWPANEPRPARKDMARAAADAEQAVVRLPRPGPQPMWTVARDIPIVFTTAQIAWWSALVAAAIATTVAAAGLLMNARGGEDAGFWRQIDTLCVLAWAAVVGGWLGKGALDSVLTRKHAAWVERTTAVDAARRLIGWPYVVARAEVEQRETEAAALREYVAASSRAGEFDCDPELGGRLAALGRRDADLASHIDGAGAVLAWASDKGWART